MARGKASTTARTERRQATPPAPVRRMGTSEARAGFSKLVAELSARGKASASLVDNAIEVGRQRKGGVWIVPEVDAQAAVEHIQELEEEIENISLSFMLSERLDRTSGETISGAQLIRELGFPDLADGLPE